MHMMITWEIGGAATTDFQYWNDQMLAVIAPYPWARPLGTTYVVQIPDVGTHTAIARALHDVVEKSSDSVRVVMTPPINGGQYSGVVASPDMWTELNRLSA